MSESQSGESPLDNSNYYKYDRSYDYHSQPVSKIEKNIDRVIVEKTVDKSLHSAYQFKEIATPKDDTFAEKEQEKTEPAINIKVSELLKKAQYTIIEKVILAKLSNKSEFVEDLLQRLGRDYEHVLSSHPTYKTLSSCYQEHYGSEINLDDNKNIYTIISNVLENRASAEYRNNIKNKY